MPFSDSTARAARALVLAAAFLLAPLGDAAAATFTDLYRITVDPQRDAPNPRSAEIREAMSALLVRVTGNREAQFDPTLTSLIDSAERDFVNAYGRDAQGRVSVTFNASRVSEALTSLGRPVWGPERPLTLLWVAFDDGIGERVLLGAGELGGVANPELAELMQATRTELATVASERGLPIALPLLDLEDLGAVGFADVWGGFEEPIRAASMRYSPDRILVGRVRLGDYGPEVQWLLLNAGERQLLAGSTLREGLEWVADIYAGQLAVSGDAGTARIVVNGVGTLGDYGRVMSYLESQSVLQNVDVEALEGGVLTLRAAARGDAEVVRRVLALGGVLRPAESGFGGPPPGTLLFEVVAGPGR